MPKKPLKCAHNFEALKNVIDHISALNKIIESEDGPKEICDLIKKECNRALEIIKKK